MPYNVSIEIDEHEIRTKACKNKDEIIEFLAMHIAFTTGDSVQIPELKNF